MAEKIIVQSYIDQAIVEQGLPSSFGKKVDQYFKPLAEVISSIRHKSITTRGPGPALVLGVQGTQGSGKSTLSEFLKLILSHEHQLNCVVLSIDDFYLTLEQRKQLSERVHPLLVTRGVPGTHDVDLAVETITRLSELQPREHVAVPRFNKAVDDRYPVEAWEKVEGPVDVIILEGWCVGIPAQEESALGSAINELESGDDPDGVWRRFVNAQLAIDYRGLFSLLQYLIVINAPSFECVFGWRLLQEQKLKKSLEKKGQLTSATKLLSEDGVKRFIAHYQRITEHGFEVLPELAHCFIQLNQNHDISSMTFTEVNSNE